MMRGCSSSGPKRFGTLIVAAACAFLIGPHSSHQLLIHAEDAVADKVAAEKAARAKERTAAAAAEEAAQREDWLAHVGKLTAQIAESPESVDLYSRRGDYYFFLGQFKEAAADYDRMASLNSELATSHWRRGIAWFYTKQYDKAAHQFEIYHSFDNVDRENGIWRYLSQYKAYGRDKARQGLLKYEKDDRQPFPDVYKLFSGELTAKQVLERIQAADITPDEREKRLFYAQLYIGLNEFIEGREPAAREHLQAAAENRWAREAGGGPGYMQHVARVHARLLAEKGKKQEPVE